MKPAPAFVLPEDVDIANQLIGRLGETTLKPDSPVYCINRGRKPITSTYDANHITIQPGLFEMEYHAALHIQRREIVPGTRNLEVGGHISWIGIFGSTDGRVAVDKPEDCVAFTDEELAKYGEALEGIDRSVMSGADRFVTPVRTQAARAMSRTQGAAQFTQIDVNQQVSDAAKEAAAHVFEPTTEPLAAREAEFQSGRRTADPPPYEAPVYEPPAVDPSLPAPRPMRGRSRR